MPIPACLSTYACIGTIILWPTTVRPFDSGLPNDKSSQPVTLNTSCVITQFAPSSTSPSCSGTTCGSTNLSYGLGLILTLVWLPTPQSFRAGVHTRRKHTARNNELLIGRVERKK